MPVRAVVRLTLEDGSTYGPTGVVEFSEVVVDQSTGTVTLRARFPNPKGVLLPGMFVRASFAQAVDEGAILVPMQGLSRDQGGQATVLVVGPGNRAVQKIVQADRTQGRFWVVTNGLHAGDKVILQGLATVKPAQPVRPVPSTTPQQLEPSKKGRSGGGGDTNQRAGKSNEGSSAGGKAN